jgi:hypothetical protein
MLHETEIDRLTEKGLLPLERRHDHVAIVEFICYALS